MNGFFRFPCGILQMVLGLSLAAGASADPVITEFMAANSKNLADADGDFSDWIELHNPNAATVNLDGWYLTDSARSKTKWKFPAISLPAGGYLVVFASNKNKRDPTRQLHTNFTLDAAGEYLALVKPDGTSVTSEFLPTFPAQLSDFSYGLTQSTAAGEVARTGFFRTPTPGARNGGAATLLLLERVAFSRPSGPFTASIALAMTGAAAGQRIRYVVVPPTTDGAVAPEPTASSPEYVGPITLSASALVRAAVFSDDGVQRGFPSTGHFVRLATSGTARLDTFSSQLPLMVIDTHGTGSLGKTSGEKASWLYTWDRSAAGASSLTPAPTAASSGATNVRGQSSADFPKKSFGLKLDDTLGHDLALPLYGLPAFDNWALIGPWNYDRTYVHNVFTYALSNRLGRWAPRTQLVELFFNADGGDLDANDYAGIYVLTDSVKVDPQRVDLNAIEPGDDGARSITGGYLLKADVPDADEFSFTTTRNYPGPPGAIVVTSPKAADLPKAQRDYIQDYVQKFEDALYADQAGGFSQRTYLDYIDRGAWVDHHLLNVLTGNADAFFRSAYLSKDRDGRLAAGPMWDNDRSMHGGDVRTERPDVWNGEGGATPLWGYGWWGVLARDPEFAQAWIDRWQSLRPNELSAARLTALVESSAAQIGPAAAARDAVKWRDNGTGGNTPRFPGAWEAEIANLKNWLERRVAWIDSQFTAPPSITSSGGTITLTPVAGTPIAYTTDGSDPRSPGGRVSSLATLSSDPVTLANTVRVQARSYRAESDASKVPSSPWSAIVGTAPTIAAQSGNQTVTVGRPVTFTVTANGTPAPTFQWRKGGVAIAGATTATLTLAAVAAPDAGDYTVVVSTAAGSVTSLVATLAVVAPGSNSAATITAQPVAQSIGSGSTVVFSVRATGSPAPGYQWRLNGVNLADASGPVLVVRTASAAQAGAYTVVVRSGTTFVTSTAAVLTVTTVDPTAFGRLGNLSILTIAGSGAKALTIGATIGGTGTNGSLPIVIRAIGPTLATAFGLGDVLADPVVSLHVAGNASPFAVNDDWGGGADLAAAFSDVGAFALPANSLDAAIVPATPGLAAGGYTVQVAGNGSAAGTVIAEMYDGAGNRRSATTPRLINLSSLTTIEAGSSLAVGFFVSGTTARTLLVRGVGPTLATAFGLGGTMVDPKLELFSNSTNQIIAENNDWAGNASLAMVQASSGAFALANSSSKDAVLLVTLAPGAYTARLSGADGGGGTAIIEVYEVP